MVSQRSSAYNSLDSWCSLVFEGAHLLLKRVTLEALDIDEIESSFQSYIACTGPKTFPLNGLINKNDPFLLSPGRKSFQVALRKPVITNSCHLNSFVSFFLKNSESVLTPSRSNNVPSFASLRVPRAKSGP